MRNDQNILLGAGSQPVLKPLQADAGEVIPLDALIKPVCGHLVKVNLWKLDRERNWGMPRVARALARLLYVRMRDDGCSYTVHAFEEKSRSLQAPLEGRYDNEIESVRAWLQHPLEYFVISACGQREAAQRAGERCRKWGFVIVIVVVVVVIAVIVIVVVVVVIVAAAAAGREFFASCMQF